MRSASMRAGRRTRRYRFAMVGAVALATTLSLAACSGGGPAGAKTSGPRTLTVQVDVQVNPWEKKMASEFEAANPGVKVNLTVITDEQKITTNGQVVAGNHAPDVAEVPTNAQSYTDLIKAKELLPLNDVWQNQNLEKRYGADLADSLKSNGTPYVVLQDKVLYNIIFYNKEAFKKAGITPPKDRVIASDADLYSMVSKLNGAGYDGISTGGNDGYKWGWMLDAQLFANAPSADLQDLTTSWQPGHTQKVKYTSPSFTASVAQLQDWYNHGVFQKGALGQSDDQSVANFTAGKAAMYLGGSFSPAQIDQQKPKFKYDWMLMPGLTDGKGTVPTNYAGDTFGISKEAKNPGLAKKWLEMLVADKTQTAMAESGTLPAVNTVDTSSIPALGAQVQSIVAYANKNGAGVGWTSAAPGGLAQTFFDPQMVKVLTKQQTVAQLAQAQQQQYEKFVQSNS